jgi:hypothetical protein
MVTLSVGRPLHLTVWCLVSVSGKPSGVESHSVAAGAHPCDTGVALVLPPRPHLGAS